MFFPSISMPAFVIPGKRQKLDLLHFLITNVSLSGTNGCTFLHTACSVQQYTDFMNEAHGSPLVTLLLEGGADVNARDESGATPLHISLSPRVMRNLVAHGACVNATTNDGLTWLHLRMQGPF